MTNPLKVMTFNLRYAGEKPPNSWAQRRPVVSECLRLAAPDVIGTQEGLFHQIQDIARDRSEYSWIGLGREGGSRGEFAAVFYRSQRLEPLEFDHFWLSDTPEVIGSKSWGNTCVRMLTWVRFRDRQTGRDFYFWNTHFDHEVQQARDNAADLVVQRVHQINAGLATPLILVGDFNAPAGANAAYEKLIGAGEFADAWLGAAQRHGDGLATYHNYQPPADGARIDWILTRGAVEVGEAELVTYQRDGQYPSDHFPVTALVSLA